MLKFCKKDFTIAGHLKDHIKTRPEILSVEIRCIRLDGRGTILKPDAGINLGRDPYEEPR